MTCSNASGTYVLTELHLSLDRVLRFAERVKPWPPAAPQRPVQLMCLVPPRLPPFVLLSLVAYPDFDEFRLLPIQPVQRLLQRRAALPCPRLRRTHSVPYRQVSLPLR